MINLPGSVVGQQMPVVNASLSRAVAGHWAGRLIGMVGRDYDVLKLSARLTAARFVTIVGSGGVGKTTVAVAVGHHLMEAFAGAVLFVDLSMLGDPDLVATVVASMLGLSVQSDDATPSLIAYLRDKRILLVLDTCEHLIEAVAALASSIFTAAPQVHILATSREALRVDGEQVYRLDPLACPPEDVGLTAAVAQTFSAPKLFVERAVASGARLDLSDAEAAIVVGICRKLDGVALAIELAARRVEADGLHQTAALLDQRLTLLWVGPRTAPPRQKTLHATLDWSYGLLSDLAVARGFKGELAIRRGDAKGGVDSLQGCLKELHAAPYELLSTALNMSLVQGLAATGRLAEGISLIDQTIRLVEANGDLCYMPELLRVKGSLLLAMPQPRVDDAEAYFTRSLELSRSQGSRVWELGTAVDFAALLVVQGRSGRARALLQPVFEQFAEGSDTADLNAAERVLATLS
jgi:predicted ATPase